MVKHINEIKIGEFFEAYQCHYYKSCKNWSKKIHSNGSTRRVHNSNINYVLTK